MTPPKEVNDLFDGDLVQQNAPAPGVGTPPK